MTPTQILTAAIEAAKVREARVRAEHGPRRFSGHSSGFVDCAIGEVGVSFVVASGRTTNRPEHMRQTWTLNGKRIARDKLIATLRDAA